jgi:hypothetical protein
MRLGDSERKMVGRRGEGICGLAAYKCVGGLWEGFF